MRTFIWVLVQGNIRYPLWLTKAVSDVAVCQKVLGVCGIVFEFLTELTDENTQVSAFISEAGAT